MLLAIVPVIIGAVVLLVVLLSKDENKYDERQELISNRSYMYAFYVVFFINIVVMMASFFEEIPKMPTIILATLSLWSGIIVQSVYSIWKHAYFPFTVKHGEVFCIHMLILAFMQALIVVIDRFSLLGGEASLPVEISLSIGAISACIISIAIFLRNYLDKRAEAEK
ncbi:hypothetical protein [Ligilactobacillus apodemi]|uniref:hypothetical protein n=1 Tax=Ligilactobacillus apodemi TaxID=307126 RepID=UPI00214B6D16|nr:hypothetical protein [Ligilactobacillus apodemi]MCR1901581.1 hypothetical protein [Ligilactobacillus apodemi]